MPCGEFESMTRDVIIFLTVLLINTVCVVLYVLWQKNSEKSNHVSYIGKALVMFVCPVLGIIFVTLSWFVHKYIMRDTPDLEDVIFSKERVETYLHADEERETNVVSMEEALAVTDKNNLRAFMLNVVRGDVNNTLASIALALDSSDSETSHYAASVLQDSLNDFRATAQKMYSKIKNYNEDEKENQEEYNEYLKLIMLFLDYMNPFLEQKVLTKMEQKQYACQMDEVGEILYEKAADRITGKRYSDIAMRLLETEEYGLCKKWCERNVESHPDTLAAYTCRMKLYFSTGESSKFFEVLNELRNSNVIIDNETLEMIRVFENKYKRN